MRIPVCAIALSTVVLFAAGQETQAVELSKAEENVIARTNAERAKRGLPPLKADASLMKSARNHATKMTRIGLQHTTQPVAENIAEGQNSSSQVVNDWMHSSGHRANILNRGHRKIGVAKKVGRNGRCYWCQQFRS